MAQTRPVDQKTLLPTGDKGAGAVPGTESAKKSTDTECDATHAKK